MARHRRTEGALNLAVLDALAVGVVLLRPDGSLAAHNPAADRLLGGCDGARTAGPWVPDGDVVDRDGRPLAPDTWPWSRAVGGQGHADGTLVGVRRSAGTTRWLVVSTQAQGGDGEPALVTVTFADVTAHVGAGHALALAAEARFGALVDASPIGMAIVGDDGAVRVANPALAELSGRDVGALRACELASLVAAEESDILRTRLRDLVDGRDVSAELELRLVRADGEIRWALVHLARLHPGDDGAPEIVCQLLDMTERRRFEEQLRHVADHDLLTGLLNRRSFEAALAAHCAHVARYGPQGALLVLDIDRFKIVNDSFGHQAGDQLIAEVAALLRDRLRATDSLARLGGDEFAALLPHASLAEAESVASALLDAVRTHVAPPAGSTRRGVTVSIGIAAFDPPDATPAEMVAAADLAMFAAKEAGRDRYTTAPSAARSGREVAGRASWVERIESALHDGRFALLAQPVVSLRTGLVAQFELFVRIVDDTELVAPERFLYLAERVDLVGLIDSWVLGQAIDLLTARADESFAVSVNLAQRSIGAPSVRDLLTQRLLAPAFDPRRLVLEVGERSAMASVAATQRFLDLVSSLGCSSALDDFGAGLGSLSYLKYLPFDFLKIDGAVVATCASSAVDRTLVSAITAVAAELGKQTIAEATPDQQTLDLLRRAGVDYAQGYFVGRPQPLETVFPTGRPAVTVPVPG